MAIRPKMGMKLRGLLPRPDLSIREERERERERERKISRRFDDPAPPFVANHWHPVLISDRSPTPARPRHTKQIETLSQ